MAGKKEQELKIEGKAEHPPEPVKRTTKFIWMLSPQNSDVERNEAAEVRKAPKPDTNL